MTLCIGTTNHGKLSEFAMLLDPLGVHVWPLSLDVAETEQTFIGNARLKARAYARHVGGLALCEDSGITAHKIAPLPGPWSARFADLNLKTFACEGEVAPTNERNSARLLSILKDVPFAERGAMFTAALVLAGPNGDILFETEQQVHGTIAEEPRGKNGWGYDPIFIPNDGFGKTWAEIDSARKNLRSHRKLAMDELFFWASQHLDVLR